jgi:hypothetical protein
VNFGKAVRAKIEKGLGVHIPVFMFRPYKAKWVQPFACFASKGAAFGSILFELILKVIVILHNHRAVVKGVVSDGAQSNKSAYAMFGIDERKENLRECNKFGIIHPMNSKNKNLLFGRCSASVEMCTEPCTNTLIYAGEQCYVFDSKLMVLRVC